MLTSTVGSFLRSSLERKQKGVLGFGVVGGGRNLTGCGAKFLCLQAQRKEAIISVLLVNIACKVKTQ